MRSARRAGCALMLVLAGVLLGCGGAESEEGAVAGVLLEPMGGSGVRGSAFFRQDGERLTGWVTVWRLKPRTAHAVHFHGPDSSCQEPGDAVAAHVDLVADARGVAFINFRTTSEVNVLRRGFYYNVHAGPADAGKSADISCGNIVPAGTS